MRRTLCLIAALVLALPGSAAADPHGPRPPFAARLAACGTGPSPDERFAVFTASMPALRGTRRMAMRFTLHGRTPAGAWRRIRARGFGLWLRSDRDRAGFVYTKRVERLRPARAYRVVVHFRWYGDEGIQRTRARRTPACRQPDPRPDLQVESVAVAHGPDDGTWRYVLGLKNAGPTGAGGFAVGAAGLERDVVRPVPGLPARERATVELVGPRCAEGEMVVFGVDVRGEVEEADERDNAFRWRCVPPIPSSA